VAVIQTVNALTRSGYILSTAQQNPVREGCATRIGTVPSRYRRVSVMLAGASSRDPHASYFGTELAERTPLPAPGARLGTTRYSTWPGRTAPRR
jgi:hypothetical protein